MATDQSRVRPFNLRFSPKATQMLYEMQWRRRKEGKEPSEPIDLFREAVHSRFEMNGMSSLKIIDILRKVQKQRKGESLKLVQIADETVYLYFGPKLSRSKEKPTTG